MARRLPRTGWKRWLDPETYAFVPENGLLRLAKRLLVSVLGFTVILIGIAMVFTPGPAIVVIPAGLAILAVEFAWARRWMRKLTAFNRLRKMRRHLRKEKRQRGNSI